MRSGLLLCKGVTAKESEISPGLVSPAQRALKKYLTFGWKIAHQGPHPKQVTNCPDLDHFMDHRPGPLLGLQI